MAEKLVSASVWETELYQHLTSHVDNERGLLETYRDAADESGSAAFKYLVDMIIEDEIRHHRRFSELASALRTDSEFLDEKPAIPRIDGWGSDPKKVLELTDMLLAQERTDARELHRLSKELSDLKDTTIWQIVVKWMEADTDKHIELLKFIKSHAR